MDDIAKLRTICNNNGISCRNDQGQYKDFNSLEKELEMKRENDMVQLGGGNMYTKEFITKEEAESYARDPVNEVTKVFSIKHKSSDSVLSLEMIADQERLRLKPSTLPAFANAILTVKLNKLLNEPHVMIYEVSDNKHQEFINTMTHIRNKEREIALSKARSSYIERSKYVLELANKFAPQFTKKINICENVKITIEPPVGSIDSATDHPQSASLFYNKHSEHRFQETPFKHYRYLRPVIDSLETLKSLDLGTDAFSVIARRIEIGEIGYHFIIGPSDVRSTLETEEIAGIDNTPDDKVEHYIKCYNRTSKLNKDHLIGMKLNTVKWRYPYRDRTIKLLSNHQYIEGKKTMVPKRMSGTVWDYGLYKGPSFTDLQSALDIAETIEDATAIWKHPDQEYYDIRVGHFLKRDPVWPEDNQPTVWLLNEDSWIELTTPDEKLHVLVEGVGYETTIFDDKIEVKLNKRWGRNVFRGNNLAKYPEADLIADYKRATATLSSAQVSALRRQKVVLENIRDRGGFIGWTPPQPWQGRMESFSMSEVIEKCTSSLASEMSLPYEPYWNISYRENEIRNKNLDIYNKFRMILLLLGKSKVTKFTGSDPSFHNVYIPMGSDHGWQRGFYFVIDPETSRLYNTREILKPMNPDDLIRKDGKFYMDFLQVVHPWIFNPEIVKWQLSWALENPPNLPEEWINIEKKDGHINVKFVTGEEFNFKPHEIMPPSLDKAYELNILSRFNKTKQQKLNLLMSKYPKLTDYSFGKDKKLETEIKRLRQKFQSEKKRFKKSGRPDPSAVILAREKLNKDIETLTQQQTVLSEEELRLILQDLSISTEGDKEALERKLKLWYREPKRPEYGILKY